MTTVSIERITRSTDGYVASVLIRSDGFPPITIDINSRVISYGQVSEDVRTQLVKFTADLQRQLTSEHLS
jgi:hypothetical protein